MTLSEKQAYFRRIRKHYQKTCKQDQAASWMNFVKSASTSINTPFVSPISQSGQHHGESPDEHRSITIPERVNLI